MNKAFFVLLKSRNIFLSMLFIVLFYSQALGGCRGCCSGHGGVVCRDGVNQCANGTSLSAKCVAKGCDNCGSVPTQAKPYIKPAGSLNKPAENIDNDKVGIDKSKSVREFSRHLYSEKHYQEKWCKAHDGQKEVVLPDGTRCDCLTATHAIEVEFAEKWAESIGQSLYYGIQTGKRPGIVLILTSPKDRKYWIRLNTVIDHFSLQIDTWEQENPATK